MAFFDSLTYLLTIYSWWTRIAALAALAGIVFSAQTEGMWAQAMWDYTPLPWMYHFEYMCYLFIVLPGSMAGELVMRWMDRLIGERNTKNTSRTVAYGMLGILISLILINLVELYNHWSLVTLVVSALFIVAGWILAYHQSGDGALWYELLLLGAAFLLIGLCFELFQGGIKKDSPTFSYFFVTSGLACMALMAFHVICDYFCLYRSTNFLVMSGQNPMIAYVVRLTHLSPIQSLRSYE